MKKIQYIFAFFKKIKIFTINNWIHPKEHIGLKPFDNYFTEIEAKNIIKPEIKNLHTMYRKNFYLDSIMVTNISITADDCYMLFVNGKLVTQAPANNGQYDKVYKIITNDSIFIKYLLVYKFKKGKLIKEEEHLSQGVKILIQRGLLS